ncbi:MULTISPECIES: transporter substrate-binding domain-containing protein [Microbulbifer]|uniref:Transporter substrate-binding domain-containing protein n=1 Tax=Microbulbifer celer TaxID=435905 RepID=A0ABW3U6T7_9GAMM|nr:MULTISPECIES: transporter substrate-binding domain-containing protein [Microbulbifer]UFN56145.1 transporter substrate-binding domain-containing protein [Microbulbifer celer]
MLARSFAFLFHIFLLCGAFHGQALGQADSASQGGDQGASEVRTVQVGLYLSPPFVMEEGEVYTGMAIDLWQEIARERNLKSIYRVYSDLPSLMGDTEQGKIDVAVTNLTVTEDRALKVDFTQPWFDAGLRVMVSTNQKTNIGDIFHGLHRSGLLTGYLWLIAVIFAATLLFTLFDRRFDAEFPSRWRDGLAESFYSVMSIVTSGRVERKNLFGWVGRIWGGLWLVCGVAVVSYITASITSVMTSLALTSQVNGLQDLPGKTVGVLAGSTAQESMVRHAIKTREFKDIEQAVSGLRSGEVQALVADAPVLAYFTFQNPGLGVRLVGKLFEPDKYAFALPRGSDLTRPISIEVIAAYESRLIFNLKEKYFGPVR